MGLSLKRSHSDSCFTLGQQLSALWLFKGEQAGMNSEAFSSMLHVPFVSAEGMAPDEEKEDGKNAGSHFSCVIYHFLPCCLQNLGQNVLPR